MTIIIPKYKVRTQELPDLFFTEVKDTSMFTNINSINQQLNKDTFISKYQNIFSQILDNQIQHDSLNLNIKHKNFNAIKKICNTLVKRYIFKIKLLKIIYYQLINFIRQLLENKLNICQQILTHIISNTKLINKSSNKKLIFSLLKIQYQYQIQNLIFSIKKSKIIILKNLKRKITKLKKLIKQELNQLKIRSKKKKTIYAYLIAGDFKNKIAKQNKFKIQKQNINKTFNKQLYLNNNEKQLTLNISDRMNVNIVQSKQKMFKYFLIKYLNITDSSFSRIVKNVKSKFKISHWEDFFLLLNLRIFKITEALGYHINKFFFKGKFLQNDIILSIGDIVTFDNMLNYIYKKIFYTIQVFF